MKRFFKKALALTMCGIIAVSTGAALTGCGRDDGVDETMSQIYLGIYDGGYGRAWFYDLKERFEEAYKDVSFQEGRVGVQIMEPDFDKDLYTPGMLLSRIRVEEAEVFFAAGNDIMDDYIDSNLLLDLTNVVTKPLSEFNESESIEDKMDAAQIEHYKRNDKYYMLPDKETAQGVIYDVDLFENKNYYFAKGGCPSEFCDFTQNNNSDAVSMNAKPNFYDANGELILSSLKFTGTGEKSAGPDGKYGTYDDGCPATYEEFLKLMQRMSITNTQPLTWFETYESYLMTALAVDYHGVDEGRILFNGGGTDGVETEVVVFNPDGSSKIERKTIKVNNYTDVAKQAGRYYALDLMGKLIEGKYYASNAGEFPSQVETQASFLRSSPNDDLDPIAMMLDGTWWDSEAEASGAFAECEEDFPDKVTSRAERRFGLMPMPKYNQSKIGTPATILTGSSHVFAKSNIDSDKVKLIETFIRFYYTDASMAQHTITSGVPLALDYGLDDTQKGQLNYFARQYWNVSDSSQKVWDYLSPEVSSADFNEINGFESTNGNGLSWVSIKLGGKSISLKEYFEGM